MRVAVLGAVLLSLLAVASCSSQPSANTAGSATRSAAAPHPHLGGPPVPTHRPPSGRMDALERPVAAQLARQVRRQGLTLDYLHCPPWHGHRSEDLTCTAYVDGVVGHVDLRLHRGAAGAVDFQATMLGGVISTHNLVERLQRAGYSAVDCGSRPAYPADPGTRLVCSVQRHGHQKYVVATVVNRSGAVDIADY